MKIYRFPVEDKFRPDHQDYVWPPQNQQKGMDYGVEQDFEWWLESNPQFITEDISKADWAYLPIYWNRYYINTPDADGHWGGGMDVLNDAVVKYNSYGIPIFTISEADIKWLEPQIDWGKMVVFCASRRDENGGIDIPLLSAPHDMPNGNYDKKWLASFVGSLGTDEIRKEMQNELLNRGDCWVEHAGKGEDYFVFTMLASSIALCPRGQGAQSFRMYEAMQLGVVPLYISDLDCRPFQKWIPWDCCSFWRDSTKGLNGFLDLFTHGIFLNTMGEEAKHVYDELLAYQKWCPFVIHELINIQ